MIRSARNDGTISKVNFRLESAETEMCRQSIGAFAAARLLLLGLRARFLRRFRPPASRPPGGLYGASAELIGHLDETIRERGVPGFIDEVKRLEGQAIDETVIQYVDGKLGLLYPDKRLIATTDPTRQPGEDEVVFQFGHYPHGFHQLGINNPVRRNVAEFWSGDIKFYAVEADPCWRCLDRIYVINKDDRPDRYYSAIRELARAGAPLDIVSRFSACVPSVKGNSRLAGTIGCLQSHLEVVRTARTEGYDHVLVLEDDFTFSDDLFGVRGELDEFFARSYDYDICLLATSRFGPIEGKDDLVGITWQPATNAAAYLLSKSGMIRVEECFARALGGLLSTGRLDKFAADRCWAELQGDRFLVFKRRLGFQLPSRSDIEGKIMLAFD